MASFLPSSIQKRLLRYALSRLELLDTDALDLERLDIAWGKRSTVELRDVGLRVKKIESLLHLPAKLELTTAKIVLLRVTVPADIHSSGIIVDAKGVEARVKLQSSDNEVKRTASDKGTGRGAQSADCSTAKNSSERKRQSRHKDIMEEDPEKEDDYIPTRKDLAKSFLAEEPLEEKKELEAALQSQSQHLQESGIYTNQDEDDEDLIGTGTGLSLPGFLANFLKGITDRLEVTVSDIDIQLDANLPSYNGLPAVLNDRIPSASAKVQAKRLLAEGLTSGAPLLNLPADSAESSTLPHQSRAGKRRVALQDICASLVSDSALFAALSTASGPSSPLDTRSELFSSDSSRAPESPSAKPTHSKGGSSRSCAEPLAESSSSIVGPPPVKPTPEAIRQSKYACPELMDPRFLTWDDRRQWARKGWIVDENYNLVRDPTRSPSPVASCSSGSEISWDSDVPWHLYNRTEVEQMREEMREERFRNKHRARETEFDIATPDLLSSQQHDESHREVSHSEPTLTTDPSFAREYPVVSEGLTQQSPESVVRKGSNDSTSSGSGSDKLADAGDLSESRVFSHEEAESMYMSAMSDATGQPSHHGNVPGSWNSADSSSSGSAQRSPSVSPALFKPGQIARDDDGGSETPRPGGSEMSEIASGVHVGCAENNERVPANLTPGSPAQERASNGASLVDSPCVAKQIVFINEVSFWLPDGSKTRPATSLDTSRYAADASIYQGLPGSFSQYAESTAPRRQRGSTTHMGVRRTWSARPSFAESLLTDPDVKDGLDMVIDTVEARVDVSAGRLLLHLIELILDVFKDGSVESHTEAVKSVPASGFEREHKMAINHLSVKLMEHLTDVKVSDLDSNATLPQVDADTGNVILRTDIDGLTVLVKSEPLSTTTKIDISSFAFGLSDHKILSFDAEARMRTSVRDVKEAQKKDVSLSYVQSFRKSDATLTTLPLQIDLDIQKLDETLSGFGGLSGVLELGSSIASNSTLLATSPKPEHQPRAVHFECPSGAAAAGTRTQVKFNARLGGLLFALKGKSCSVSLHTSAVKVVAREKAVAVQIDEAKLQAPVVDSSRADPPFIVELDNTRLDYLYTPEEADLTRLVSLICPSKDKYEDDDDILLDTLLRQRKQGSLIRFNVSAARIDILDLDAIQGFHRLSDEMAKLATVAKYLPEDDRPGILTLALIKHLDLRAVTSERIGTAQLGCQGIQVAHVGLPSLVAFEIGRLYLTRNKGEKLVTEVLLLPPLDQLPMVMARMIGDEMEPTVKVKLFNMCVEYRIPTIMALLGLSEGATTDDIASSLAASVATVTGYSPLGSLSRQPPESSDNSSTAKKPLNVDLLLRDCAIGLNPRNTPSKGLFLFSNARLTGVIPVKFEQEMKGVLQLRKATLLLINDPVNNLAHEDPASRPTCASFSNRHVDDLCQQGYVSVCTISAAKASVGTVGDKASDHKSINVDFNDALFVLETCADTTQTLVGVLNGLSPPIPPSRATQYLTKPMPIENMMASFTGEAEVVGYGEGFAFGEASPRMDDADPPDEEMPAAFDMVGSFYDPRSISPSGEDPNITESFQQQGEHTLLESFQEHYEGGSGNPQLDFDNDYFAVDSNTRGVTHKWDSVKNQYDLNIETYADQFPLRVRVRNVHVIWNLFDGYDWLSTRETIAGAVKAVEAKAEERRRARRRSLDDEDDKASAVGDFLFNSIWIEVPANRDPQELHRQINRNMDELVSDTASYTGTAMTPSSSRGGSSSKPRVRRSKGLRLERSRRHKITFELKGVDLDFAVWGPGSGETQSSLDVGVHDFEIFDHIPTSTWKKFATYDRDAGERELWKPMIRLELMNVKPVPELTASEIVLKATVQPLRLHVDQDALDFITRFFEFKDDSLKVHGKPDEPPFLQRVEVGTVHLKLDYKPKKVDYAGLRSGHTTEFMNFVILDAADITLKRAIIYGISGFDRLHQALNDVWMPDVKRNQLPGVLSGLAPVRPLVNVGAGVRDLVMVPVREYKKDGRIMRSIQKGAVAFVQKTSSELAGLGARVAVGTQNILEGAEGLLSPSASSAPRPVRRVSDDDWDNIGHDAAGSPTAAAEKHRNTVSHYANQPLGVLAGLRGAAQMLERDLLIAKDAVIAIPGEVMESGSAAGAVKAIVRKAPTVILRPAMGATKVVSQVAMGVQNQVDVENRRRVDDKYKKH